MPGGGEECRVYVGNLPPDIRNKDLDDLFYKYGKIVFIDLKNRRGPPFAFIEFEDPRDAEDAVHARDGYDYDGYKLRVEFPRGGGGSFRDGPGGGGRGRGGAPARRSQYRVEVTGEEAGVCLTVRSFQPKSVSLSLSPSQGLPASGSWQDLKDHMREAGDVCFADVNRDGTGSVEYMRYEDMKYAIKKLDDSKFRSHEVKSSNKILSRLSLSYSGHSPPPSPSTTGRDGLHPGEGGGRLVLGVAPLPEPERLSRRRRRPAQEPPVSDLLAGQTQELLQIQDPVQVQVLGTGRSGRTRRRQRSPEISCAGYRGGEKLLSLSAIKKTTMRLRTNVCRSTYSSTVCVILRLSTLGFLFFYRAH